MTEPDDRDDDPTIHRLDTGPADLGSDLRALFAPLLRQEVPADLARLGAELEAKLAQDGGGRASADGRDGDGRDSSAAEQQDGHAPRVVTFRRGPPDA